MGTIRKKTYLMVLAEDYPLIDPQDAHKKMCIPGGTVIKTFASVEDAKIPLKWAVSSAIREVRAGVQVVPRGARWTYTVTDMDHNDVRLIEKTVYITEASCEVVLTSPLPKANSPGRKKIILDTESVG